MHAGRPAAGQPARVCDTNAGNRGWSWTASEIRRVQLLEWVAEESAEHPERYVEVKAFYDVRPDQSENDIGLASDDLT